MKRLGTGLTGRLGSFALLVLASCSAPTSTPGLFELATALSEPGGYFDTDNIISNETAYVQVVDALEPTGGVYIGVGPEQNFHYIGRIRPSWAFIVDIRRDNQLHHLLLNAALSSSASPYGYLCFLFSRDCDDDLEEGDAEGIEGLLTRFDAAEPSADRFENNLSSAIEHIETRLGFELDEDDRGVIDSLYRSYFHGQLGLRFRSHGRRPMPHHPTYRRLLVSESPSGRPSHFLAHPEDYAYVRELALAGRLVPVVGDFAGGHALRGIAAFVEDIGETVSAFYVSNVEFYLLRGGVFGDYVENVRELPRSASAQFIRAYFSYGYPHPEALPGHRSTLVRQNMNRFLELYDEGAFGDYWDVSTLDYER